MSIRDQRDAIADGINSAANQAIDRTARVANRAADISSQMSTSLKGVGIDTDQLADVAMRQAGAFETALIETIRARPIRSIALAAFAGLLIGVARGR